METEKIIVSEEMKISNGLLSAVFGCECEFVEISDNCIKLKPDHILNIDTDILANYCCCTNGIAKINIHTFIHLAKGKIFEEFRYFFSDMGATYDRNLNLIYKPTGENINRDSKSYSEVFTGFTIEALEWVNTEIEEG